MRDAKVRRDERVLGMRDGSDEGCVEMHEEIICDDDGNEIEPNIGCGNDFQIHVEDEMDKKLINVDLCKTVSVWAPIL